MFRNYLAAALGALARSPLYAFLNVFGLALGLAAALVIALFVRDELSFDRFAPGSNDVYLLTSIETVDRFPAPVRLDSTFPALAGSLKLDFPQIASVARIMIPRHPPHLRHGGVEADEFAFDWVDPDFFDVLRLKAVAGDPATALRSPDAVVLTRAAARKYFGRDAPLGQILMVDPAMGPKISSAFDTPHPMRVAAVIEDLPSQTTLTGQVFASGLAPFSKFALYEQTRDQGPLRDFGYTFVRLNPGVSADEIRPGLPSFVARHAPPGGLTGIRLVLDLTPIARLHLAPAAYNTMKPRGSTQAVAGIAAIGVLILLSASINFVTLMTARAGRRAIETGIRKAVGASRGALVAQFLGEALIYVALAMAAAVVLTELSLPLVNAALKRKIDFDYVRDPTLIAGLVLATLSLGLGAGFYPALVLSAWRPATALKGGIAQGAAGSLVRKCLVALQFAILIGLIVATTTLYRQTSFALRDRLRLDASTVLLIDDACSNAPGTRAFRDLAATAPGVEASACTSAVQFENDGATTEAKVTGGRAARLMRAPVGFGFLEFYGQKPLAGRFFAQGKGADARLTRPGATGNPAVVLNQTALGRLGFATPADAVGRSILWTRYAYDAQGVRLPDVTEPSEIIGVAPDLSVDTRKAVEPQILYVDPSYLDRMTVRLSGRRLPEALAALDRDWARTGHRRINRYFLDQWVQAMYADVILQGRIIGVGAALALVIAALGLFGLSAHAAEQRTKEIGVRKAMGASSGDIVRLLLWQFSQPVLWANLLAWPAAWWAMTWWLKGFAYHVDLPIWLFLAAGAGAIAIACLTVLTHALLVARATPATALRYE